jgi:hypothetical protein
MEAGTLGEELNPRAGEMFRTLQTLEPRTASEQSAFDTWLSQRQAREAAPNDRIHGAVGVGGLRPVAMERALQVIDQELRVSDADTPPPCDARGNAL